MTTGTTKLPPPPIAVILAAGKGTRMNSDLPKVLHPVAGRPMIHAVVDACRVAGCRQIVLVVGFKQELVRGVFTGTAGVGGMSVEFVEQPEQLGTGHAVMCCKAHLSRAAAKRGQPVLVLAGDGPLIRASTLRAILDRHHGDGQSGHADATLATSRIADPTGYGRIIRDAEGRFSAIVEHKHCTPEQLAVREVNPSYYCFDAKALFEALPQLKRNQPSGEYYITDVFEHMLKAGQRVEVIPAVPPEDVLSINTPEQLAEVDAIFRARVGGQGRQGGSR